MDLRIILLVVMTAVSLFDDLGWTSCGGEAPPSSAAPTPLPDVREEDMPRLAGSVHLERVVPGNGFEMVESSKALAYDGMTVVRLWASYDKPSAEFNDMQDLFTRAPRWGKRVRFVPVRVEDSRDSTHAYRAMSGKMPATEDFLIDHGIDGGIVRVLMNAGVVRSSEIPLTLALDRELRVRWSRMGPLSREDVAALAAAIDSKLASSSTIDLNDWSD